MVVIRTLPNEGEIKIKNTYFTGNSGFE